MYVEENRPRTCQADTFSALSDIAINALRELGKSVIVCGPITTGGRGSAEKNIRAFEVTILYLKSQGITVFDQVPYESTLWTLKDRWEKAGNPGYCMPILIDFYLPLYRSKLIYRAYFLPGWESSFGARWERKELADLGVEIVDLEVGLIDRLILED